MKTYLLIAAAIACFLAGWLSNGWRIGSREQRGTATALVDLQARMEDQVEKITAFNKTSSEAELKLLASMRRTNAELRGIRDEIAQSDVGRCTLAPDGDRLRDAAYRSAVAPRDLP